MGSAYERDGQLASHARRLSTRASATPLLLAALLSLLLVAPLAHAAFGIGSFSATATNQDGTADLLAGSHPFAYTIDFAMNTDAEGEPEGSLYGLDIDLPPGLIGNPQSVPRCSGADFEGSSTHCPANAQVGVIHADTGGLGTFTIPIFNLTPPLGYTAAFGGAASGNTAIELVSLVGSGHSAHLRISAVLPTGLGVKGVSQTLWGVPADHGHDGERGACLEAGGQCPVELNPAPLLTLPPSCGPPLTTTLEVHPVEAPALDATAVSISQEDGGEPRGMLGCDGLPFAPTLSVSPEPAALSPTGLQLGLDLPPTQTVPGRSAATIDRLSLSLPPGLTLNPPAATGLGACSPGQIGLESPPGEAARFDAGMPRCPGSSTLGSATAEPPGLDHPLRGAIYLATPEQNPFGTLFAIYIVFADPASGILIKLPGRLDTDPGDGRITATVEQLPQLPLGDLQLEFFGGPRAMLANPPACGTFAATAEVVPSSAPEGPTARLRSSFSLDRGADFAPCPPSPLSGDLSFEAGTAVPIAGLQTPFVLRLQREDASRQLGAFDLTLPPGLSARPAGVAVCDDAAIPACPASSSVGQATIGVGVGSAPLYLRGTVYLGGPHRGAPFSLVVAVPADAGPFDLGVIVVRAAVRINRKTGQISAASDPLPRILRGVPLSIRSLALSLDRPGFTRNPTSCEPMAVSGEAVSVTGQAAALRSRFQVGACAGLGFHPRLAVGLLGPTHRGAHPKLRAVIRPRPGDADLRSLAVTLPGTELLDSRHIRDVCSRAAFVAGACPPGSAYGRAEVWTPLLDHPLAGPVYLIGGRHRLPDLGVSLAGQVPIDLIGRLGSRRGRLWVDFENLPDAPVAKFVLELRGGRQGLLVNTGGICSRQPRVKAAYAAQSGRTAQAAPLVRSDCNAARR